jgi:molybdopterin converting factor small subunit
MRTVSVGLFAGLQGLVGAGAIEVPVADGATVADLRASIIASYPVLEPMMGTLVVAVGEEVVAPEARLPGDGRIELIPPIAGGDA